MAGIYLHIPFCKQKCSYCDFHFSTVYDKYRNNMIEAMIAEIALRKDYLNGAVIETLYFGGGTPSLLLKEELALLISAVKKNHRFSKSIEFTLEANPDDITSSNLQNWRALGVNRLSIGLQSFKQEDLDWMNRAHTAKESIQAVQLAQAFDFCLSVDLMYGLPYRNVREWKENIQHLVDLNPEHISAYCLTIEKKTALAKMIDNGDLVSASEDEQADQFLSLIHTLDKAGYEQYEISNFARNAFYALHNTNYWKGINYLGIGPSAHSFNGISRQWNIANNPKYIKSVLGKLSFFEAELLSSKDRFNELLLTGFRTKWGVNKKQLELIYQPTDSFFQQIKGLEKLKLLRENTTSYHLTEAGKLRADRIASDLFII